MKFIPINVAICIICTSFGHSALGQMSSICSQLPKVKWSSKWQNDQPAPQLKLDGLAFILKGDSVQFELPEYDIEQYPDSPRYFPLDTAGIHYVDLDFDGDLDLLYSGQSGRQNIMSTKVFINDENLLQLHKIISGRIIDLHQQTDCFEICTLWLPCCDSYTSRIETYSFANKILARTESISIIGFLRTNGTPDFDNLKSGHIKNNSLYAFQDDFRGLSPYFQSDNKILRDSLKAGHPIQLIKLVGRTNVKLIDQKEIQGQKWYLVITEAITDAAASRYEWSTGENQRFVGWTKKIKMN